MGLPGQTSYCATKASVKLLSEAMWAEMEKLNIGVTSVHPGAIKTDMIQATLKNSDDLGGRRPLLQNCLPLWEPSSVGDWIPGHRGRRPLLHTGPIPVGAQSVGVAPEFFAVGDRSYEIPDPVGAQLRGGPASRRLDPESSRSETAPTKGRSCRSPVRGGPAWANQSRSETAPTERPFL